LSQIRAVDPAAYPFYGKVELEPAVFLSRVLTGKDKSLPVALDITGAKQLILVADLSDGPGVGEDEVSAAEGRR
jgi:predicted lysophospholipase L1 biosynthesis ABC-type transport system permease subunit